MRVLRGDSVCFMCIYPDLSCSLVCTMQLEEESEVRSRARDQASCIWIPDNELDQSPKLGFLCLSGAIILRTSETAHPHESLWREKQFFRLAFVFPWLRFVLITGVFKIGLIKAHSPPAGCHNLTKFVLCWKPCAIYLKSKSGEQTRNSSPCAFWLQESGASTVLAQNILGQPHSGHKEGPFTALDESQQQEELLGAVTAYVKTICILQGNETGVHPLVLL